jgi:hypothetical protein
MSEGQENNQKGEPVERPYEITPEGSLGLLALGAVGIREWRKVRDAAKPAEENSSEEENK